MSEDLNPLTPSSIVFQTGDRSDNGFDVCFIVASGTCGAFFLCLFYLVWLCDNFTWGTGSWSLGLSF